MDADKMIPLLEDKEDMATKTFLTEEVPKMMTLMLEGLLGGQGEGDIEDMTTPSHPNCRHTPLNSHTRHTAAASLLLSTDNLTEAFIL